MSMNVTMRVDGLNKPVHRLAFLGQKLKDPGVGLLRALDEIAEANVQRIETGRGIRKDAKSTQDRKRRQGHEPGPLREQGALLDSLRPHGPGNILKIYRTVGRYGTSVPHAHLQITRKSVKPRRVVVVQKAARQKAVKALHDEITEPLR